MKLFKNKIQKRTFLFGCLILTVCLFAWVFNRNSLRVDVSFESEIGEEGIRVEMDSPIAKVTNIKVRGKMAKVYFQSLKAGESTVRIYHSSASGRVSFHLKVSSSGFIVDTSTGNFGAYDLLLLMVTIYFVGRYPLLCESFYNRKEVEIYSYETLFTIGRSLFSLSLALIFVYMSISHFNNPFSYNAASAKDFLLNAEFYFVILSIPFVLSFATGMMVSNLQLIKHEGFRINNLLGSIIGVFMILAVLIAFWIYGYYTATPKAYQTKVILQGIYCTVFTYFESLLIGAILCSLIVATHEPDYDKDYLIILGCKIKKDGTLYPLVRQRVDRALLFYQKQLEASGKKAVFVPSGGQGKDEVISEALAIKNYLMEQGIEESQILVEDKSSNTRENMLFSRQLIETYSDSYRAAFSTSEYHVYRSGMISRDCQFTPTGMGARTKWYFWPNAFVREVVGLLASKYKTILVSLLWAVVSYVLEALFIFNM